MAARMLAMVRVVLLKTDSLFPPPQVSKLSPPQYMLQLELDDSIPPPFEKELPQ